jgi:hypothetical protein
MASQPEEHKKKVNLTYVIPSGGHLGIVVENMKTSNLLTATPPVPRSSTFVQPTMLRYPGRGS